MQNGTVGSPAKRFMGNRSIYHGTTGACRPPLLAFVCYLKAKVCCTDKDVKNTTNFYIKRLVY
jgi:hypothetical protein